MKKRILIVGGSSGLGLELATHYIQEGHSVCITGRHNPQLAGAAYQEFVIDGNSPSLGQKIDAVLAGFPRVNTLIYAAGYCQRGLIDSFSDAEILEMTQVGMLAPMMFVRRLKNNLPTPLKVMLITSSSQYTPREMEPVYCATKAGLGMFGASLVRDKEIGKVLVAAPSGMQTSFWRDTDTDVAGMLDARWVAEQVVELSSGSFKYKYAKILRDPARVVVEECLDNELANLS